MAKDRSEWRAKVAAVKAAEPPEPKPEEIARSNCDNCQRYMPCNDDGICSQCSRMELPSQEEIAARCKQFQPAKDAERERRRNAEPYEIPRIDCGSIPKPRAKRD